MVEGPTRLLIIAQMIASLYPHSHKQAEEVMYVGDIHPQASVALYAIHTNSLLGGQNAPERHI